MNRDSLLHYLRVLDIKVDTRQSNAKKIVGFCPFAPWRHKKAIDRRPSFAAFPNEEKMSGFKCMACHSKGSIRKLVLELSRLRGKDYGDLLPEINLSEEYALSHFPEYEALLRGDDYEQLPEPLDEALYEGIYPELVESRDGLAYVEQRGISSRTASSLGMLFDDEESRVLFPVYKRREGGDGADLYGFTGRSTLPDQAIKVKDYFGLPKRFLILGEERWVVGRPLIIVEGLFAYASLHNQGVSEIANIGALLGSVLTPEKRDIIVSFGEPTFLLLDNDDGGDVGLFGSDDGSIKGAIEQLNGFVPLFVPSWPEGKIDPDQLTFSEVEQMLRETPPYF